MKKAAGRKLKFCYYDNDSHYHNKECLIHASFETIPGVRDRTLDAACRDGETEPEKSQISPRYTVPGTEVFDLRSGRTGLDYRIFVHIPVKPAPDAGYPVLYTVDGNAYFGSFAEAMRLQTRHPRGLPSGMIVSIGYPSDEPFVSERRFLDLTVPAMQEDLRPDGTAWPCNGGAEHFLAFIEHELMPEIRRRYRVDDSKQALFGHSLGGFFTLYTLITPPPCFKRISPEARPSGGRTECCLTFSPALRNTCGKAERKCR